MRRLRENAMLEAEINPSGDVVVEGHHVGALQGFRFSADQAADGEDAKAVKAAAQKALAQEFDTRAERFAVASNGDFALASDGLLRWIGAPVATLTAGEDPLTPRLILLADEQLTGPARDKVAARAERFVRYQIETLLKPLFDLRNAEQLTGIARGIAFRLTENFGLLNRRDVADDVKALDQEARAALRRLGVRFGAFHIFVPALLKPGPAGLVTLLWSLGNDGKDKPGFGDVVNALASGRTSLVVEPSYEPTFYQLAGYRTLGRRAVRVDILERLADLIRPALAWRAGTGPRPEGAFDGAAFTVTPAMMSILGATADDMEEILKGLGYRAEAKPAAEVQARLDAFDTAERERVAAAQAAADAAKQVAVETPAEAPADEPATETLAAGEAEGEPATSEAPIEPAAPSESATEATPAATAEDQPAEAVSNASAPAPAEDEAVVEEPKPILLWRPVRHDGRQRHGRGRGAPNHGPNQGKGEQRREGGERQGRGGDGGDRERERGKKFKGKGDGRRDERRSNDRPGGKPREERPARIDPDSPFAKLAALREQLKK